MDPQQFGILESSRNCSLDSLRKDCGKGAVVSQTFRIQLTNPRPKISFGTSLQLTPRRSSNIVSFFPLHGVKAFSPDFCILLCI